tara:strand:- start:42 stop:230 length:189 start_codon:yes stop_codon:yes gene_type:complete
MKAPYKKVIDFYNKTTPEQHQFFLQLMSDKITFFNMEKREEFEIDKEWDITFNGIFHQINIK